MNYLLYTNASRLNCLVKFVIFIRNFCVCWWKYSVVILSFCKVRSKFVNTNSQQSKGS